VGKKPVNPRNRTALFTMTASPLHRHTPSRCTSSFERIPVTEGVAHLSNM
jgi:hypothetical protein